MSYDPTTLIPAAASKINREVLIKKCQCRIDSIESQRAAWAIDAENSRQDLISKFRRRLYARLFLKKADDDTLFREYAAGIDGYSWTYSYRGLLAKAKFGMENQMNMCLRLKALAEASTEDEIWVSDVAFSLL